MRSIWPRLLGLDSRAVLEGVGIDKVGGDGADDDRVVVVARVRVSARWGRRCGCCERRCPGYDAGEGRRRWRALDAGTVMVWLQADAPPVRCDEHGVVVAAVPWARHGSRQTRAFEDTVAWLVTQCSKTAVTRLMRVAWRTVGSIVERVLAEVDAAVDRYEGLRRIGIDEISYRKGQKFLTVVVDHDSGRLVWAAPGRNSATLAQFFDVLGEERSQQLTHVSGDGADWIAKTVARRRRRRCCALTRST